ALRDTNPSVVVIPTIGIIGFAKDKREARITTEFFVNAIHVMAGATALDDADTFRNYVALPRSEAFRIEYWALEEAKLQRMPPERELSRKIALVVGGASGIGREVALQLARRGAHVVVADQNADAAEATAAEARALSSPEMCLSSALDLSLRDSIADAVRRTVLGFGGVDIVVNTAAIYPAPERSGSASEAAWTRTLLVNVTSIHMLADEVAAVLKAQNLTASIVLTT